MLTFAEQHLASHRPHPSDSRVWFIMRLKFALRMLLCSLVIAVCSGCPSGPPPVRSPKLNIKAAAAQAIADYDTNGDGKLDKTDYEEHPSVGEAFKEVDANGDGAVDEQELIDRMTNWRDGKGVGAESPTFMVYGRGAPAVGAEVTLEPFPFMGESFHTATGTTDETGMARPAVPPEHRPEGERRFAADVGRILQAIGLVHGPRQRASTGQMGNRDGAGRRNRTGRRTITNRQYRHPFLTSRILV